MDESTMEFHRRFRVLYDQIGLSDQELALRLRTSRPNVERWRTGRAAPFRFAQDQVIAAMWRIARGR